MSALPLLHFSLQFGDFFITVLILFAVVLGEEALHFGPQFPDLVANGGLRFGVEESGAVAKHK